MADGRPIGGLTAHELPMTRAETAELLIYDLAVQADQQRRGVGRALVQQPLAHTDAADIGEVWVPAENEDTHALEFYRRTGGAAQAVTTFTYPTTDRSPARSKDTTPIRRHRPVPRVRHNLARTVHHNVRDGVTVSGR